MELPPEHSRLFGWIYGYQGLERSFHPNTPDSECMDAWGWGEASIQRATSAFDHYTV